MKQVTLDDIAGRLSLSKYSVSRALSGKSGVSEHTRRLVLHAARELGYDHPALTQSQDTSVGGNIILLIPRQDVYDSEFWMEVISGAEQEAERLGFALITRPLAGDTLMRPNPNGVRGLIVAGSGARDAMAAYLEARVPITLITYPLPLEPFDTVTIADCEGAYRVGSHLLELGHQALAFVTDRPHKPSSTERARGFREALGQAGLQPQQLVLDPNNPGLSFEGAYAALSSQGEAPSGIFASTDGVAFNVIWALNRLGLKVPQDVSVVGFNDTLQAAQFVPKLTTLRVPRQHIGMVAMRNLFQQIRGDNPDAPPQRLSLAPEFILRDSTAPAPKQPPRKGTP